MATIIYLATKNPKLIPLGLALDVVAVFILAEIIKGA